MGESKLLLALFCNKKLTKTVRGVVVVVFSVRFGCVTLTVTLEYYSAQLRTSASACPLLARKSTNCRYFRQLDNLVYTSAARLPPVYLMGWI